MTLALCTSNVHKWQEACRLVGQVLERVELDLPEVQAATVREVAAAKAKEAFSRLGRPVIIEDAGLELAAFGRFPGPFIKYWESLGGLPSICRALDGSVDRSATAVCVLAVVMPDGVQTFEGRVAGTIALGPRGHNGFGWDTIFVPEGEARTFAEMTAAEKDARSHRRAAWKHLRAATAD